MWLMLTQGVQKVSEMARRIARLARSLCAGSLGSSDSLSGPSLHSLSLYIVDPNEKCFRTLAVGWKMLRFH